jgi:hypothetical protein
MSAPDDKPDDKPVSSWRRPTRRMFVALLGGAAAAIALPKVAPAKSPRVHAGPTRWIGHC